MVNREMIHYFNRRTNFHLGLVSKYIDLISEEFSELKLLRDRIRTHDLSKFEEPELTPYILLTWKYYCKDNNIPFNLSDETEEAIREATYHHIKNNRHHPEYHDNTTTIECINPKNRDKPSEKMVDGTKMSNHDIAEMVADWMAMSEERGGHPKDWADMNVNKRWKFTNKQKDLIYEIIKTFKKVS